MTCWKGESALVSELAPRRVQRLTHNKLIQKTIYESLKVEDKLREVFKRGSAARARAAVHRNMIFQN